ncbi:MULTISPECIES: RagB/SusD family nutrient uptake outer membrane protein [Chryseobacterium]|uniref:RagB/SusD family nutrient uptake outer membrane protein n=1 Tax=Candidatus Chryseobacterium massiliense TaxID=204089 RepID=A0A3D9BAF1_9FLAO|nr:MULTISPECIES: RagB/SusD family nutrient uptake outer membrane protein [Chryseobacterium]REC50630.1 RagB/SusD family nutrient uptake outer membrane protein [Candidatus Chryseobacterium massiliae]
MKTTIHKIAWAGMLSILTTCFSCEKMLEVETPENQIDKEMVFEDVQTANAALAGLYAGVRDNSMVAGDQMGPILGTYTDDLENHAVTTANGIIDIYRNQHIENNSVIYSAWSSNYQQVYTANAILEGLESSQALPQSQKQRMKGEALFLRTLLLYYQQQLFGDIPYPVTTNYMINQTIAKTPSAEVLERLESDLMESANLLNDAYTNAERIFVNKKAAEMLLAKVLMHQNRWQEAEALLKGIIQSSLYTWEADVSKVFLKTGKHIIFQLKPALAGDPTREANIYYFGTAAPTNYSLSTTLYNSFSAADQRRQKWIAAVPVGSTVWYRADKYKVRLNNSTEYSIVFRLEEAYLLLAECLAQQSKISEALPYVNATRLRAGLTALPASMTQVNLLNAVLDENRKEFFAEMGKRFFDLKRAGQLSQLLSAKPNWQPFHQLWPIPQKELLLNPAMKPQNTGY